MRAGHICLLLATSIVSTLQGRCGCVHADTPGVHLQHRLQHLLEGDAVKQLLPKGRLKPFTPPSPQQLAERAQAESGSPNRCYTPEGM